MKKLLLLTTLFLVFACSKDDEDNSSEPKTFLEKYDGTSWRDDSKILTFIDGTYFYNFVDTNEDVPLGCNKLKDGFQTIEGDQLEATITKNEPDEMIVEIKYGGVLGSRNRFNVNGETLTDRATYFDEDGNSSNETETSTKTSASYFDYCD